MSTMPYWYTEWGQINGIMVGSSLQQLQLDRTGLLLSPAYIVALPDGLGPSKACQALWGRCLLSS
jgi:hypothetical protein